ncbi:MAG: molybdopterin converting factor subunit 1 [Pseudomonadota bacterium]|jgi:molybdopterin synthase sulfur carrier subunit
MIRIRVFFFASLRESLGALLELQTEAVTIGALRQALMTQSEAHAQALGNHRPVRAAVNQVMAADDHALHDGDEVAFFPPVTGG